MNHQVVKLTSGIGEAGLRAHTRVPWYVAMQSPTLQLILDRGKSSIDPCGVFLENITNSVTLESVTPDALHQCVNFLRDPTTAVPELSCVIETLYAAKYLELGTLNENVGYLHHGSSLTFFLQKLFYLVYFHFCNNNQEIKVV